MAYNTPDTAKTSRTYGEPLAKNNVDKRPRTSCRERVEFYLKRKVLKAPKNVYNGFNAVLRDKTAF